MLCMKLRPRKVKSRFQLYILKKQLWQSYISTLNQKKRDRHSEDLIIEQRKMNIHFSFIDFSRYSTLPDHTNFSSDLLQSMKRAVVKMRNYVSVILTQTLNLLPVFIGSEDSYFFHQGHGVLGPAVYMVYEIRPEKVFSSHRQIHSASSEQIISASRKGIEESATSQIEAEKKPVSMIHIKYMAEVLQCSVQEMQQVVEKHSFFRHMSLNLLERKVSLLLSYGIPSSYIIEHPRALYHSSYEELSMRLQLLKEHSFLEKDSLLQKKENLDFYLEIRNDYFPRVFQTLCDQRLALEGCPDRMAYLMFRLECSQAVAKELLESYPLNRNISNVRVKKLLDFFLNEAKLSPKFVIYYRKLMHFSVDRLRLRWKVMQKAGIKSESLMAFIWCKPQKTFEQEYKVYLDLLDKETNSSSNVS